MLARSCSPIKRQSIFYPTETGCSQSNSTIPVITQHPIGSIGSPGDTIFLCCAAEGGVHLIEWFRDDTLVENGLQHSITMLDEENAGSYTCRATVNGVGSVTSATAKVEFACKCSTN